VLIAFFGLCLALGYLLVNPLLRLNKMIIRTVKIGTLLLSAAFILIVSSWAAWTIHAGTVSAKQPSPPLEEVPSTKSQEAKRASKSASPDLAALQEELKAQAQLLRQLELVQNMPERISRDYDSSVGLIVGEYIWTDSTGSRPLRYQGLDASGDYLRDQQGHELMSFGGLGPVVVREFQGSGFLIDPGHLLTSGFILAPWSSDPLIDETDNPEIFPSIRSLNAYFPRARNGVKIKIDHPDESGDAVVCVIDGEVPGVALTLSGDSRARTGEPILVLGYPGGVNLLSSRIPGDLLRELNNFGHPTADETAEFLAQHGYIQPIAMLTHVSGQTENRIFFETLNAYGNTGGPLVNSRAEVVGISEAIHPEYPSFNLGISVAQMKSWLSTSLSKAK
jgi:hypothetical protein